MSFYVLTDAKVEGGEELGLAVTDFITVDPMNVGDAPLCPVCKKPLGMLPWLPPYRVELEFWGNEAGDIAFGQGDELLVSEQFRQLYIQANLAGLSGFHPAEIVRTISHGKKIKPVGDYYVVTIARSRALVDDRASGLFRPKGRYCDECGRGDPEWAKRIVFEENTWSGEDIFYVRGLPGRIMTSQRYWDFHMENRINNGVLIEASQYSFDWRLGEGYTPG